MMKIIVINCHKDSIVYGGLNPQGEKVYYAINVLSGAGDCEVVRLCKELEPQAKSTPKVPMAEIFEMPKGSQPLAATVRRYIESN